MCVLCAVNDVDCFQNNPHKLTLVMTPEEDYNNKCRDAEMRKLMDKVSALSYNEKENIFKTGSSFDNISCTESILAGIFAFVSSV